MTKQPDMSERYFYWVVIGFFFLLGLLKSYEVHYWYRETIACIAGGS